MNLRIYVHILLQGRLGCSLLLLGDVCDTSYAKSSERVKGQWEHPLGVTRVLSPSVANFS